MFKTTLFVTLALVLTKATDFTILNQCPTDLTLNSDTMSGTSPIPDGGLVVPAGQTVPVSATDWAGNIYAGTEPGVSLLEFALDQSGTDFYDISFINGFSQGLQITPSNGCAQVSCPSTPCSQAYMQPTDDQATQACTTGASYQITFCP
jgi:hypothetical protein